MQTVKAYEFEDLAPEIAAKVKDEFINEQVEADLRVLFEDLDAGLITEEQCYKTIGCTKYYADVTAWFVPSCYYEHNTEQVEVDVADTLERVLFNQYGTIVEYKEVANAVAQSS